MDNWLVYNHVCPESSTETAEGGMVLFTVNLTEYEQRYLLRQSLVEFGSSIGEKGA